MQKIAREINFNETTFILSGKQDNGGYDVRIFTPDVEVPFAGHPTLGTAFIIQKVLENNESKQITLNLKVGQIPVNIEGEQLIMKQNQPELGTIIPDQDIFTEILQIPNEDIDSVISDSNCINWITSSNCSSLFIGCCKSLQDQS